MCRKKNISRSDFLYVGNLKNDLRVYILYIAVIATAVVHANKGHLLARHEAVLLLQDSEAEM